MTDRRDVLAGRELEYLRGCRDLRQSRRIADSVTHAVTHAFFAPNRPPNRGHSTKFHLPLVSYFFMVVRVLRNDLTVFPNVDRGTVHARHFASSPCGATKATAKPPPSQLRSSRESPGCASRTLHPHGTCGCRAANSGSAIRTLFAASPIIWMLRITAS